MYNIFGGLLPSPNNSEGIINIFHSKIMGIVIREQNFKRLI